MKKVMLMKRDIRLQRVYPHPPQLVWRAITDANLMKQWMQMDNNFKPEVGHRFELRDISGNWDGTLYCEVIHIDPPQQLVYSFKGGAMKHETIVTITLIPQGDGTQLKLEHTGFTGLIDIAISGIIGLGWRRMFRLLSQTLTEQRIETISDGSKPDD